jgi:hypothetical protein
MRFWFLTWVRIWIVIFWVRSQCNLQSGYKHGGRKYCFIILKAYLVKMMGRTSILGNALVLILALLFEVTEILN